MNKLILLLAFNRANTVQIKLGFTILWSRWLSPGHLFCHKKAIKNTDCAWSMSTFRIKSWPQFFGLFIFFLTNEEQLITKCIVLFTAELYFFPYCNNWEKNTQNLSKQNFFGMKPQKIKLSCQWKLINMKQQLVGGINTFLI